MTSIDQQEAAPTESEEVIIFLVALDDPGTIRTKLEQVRGRRVALVVPPLALALRRGLAVRLVRRIAEGFAIDLSLITSDGEIQRLAHQEDVRVFNSIRGFRRHVSERAQHKPMRRRRALAGFDRMTKLTVAAGGLVAMMLIVLIIAFALIPSATVTLRPTTEPIGETIEMRADPEAHSIDYVGRRIPGRAIYDQAEGTDQVPVTGLSQNGEGRAQGPVRFINGTRQEVTVPAGTIVATPDGVKYVVLADVHIAPAQGAWAHADVRAVDQGAKGNVPRGRIAVVEGSLAQQVSVLNEDAIGGGGPGGTGYVSSADQKRLHDQLYDRLSKEALAKLQAGTKQNETVLPQTVQLDVLEESYDRRVNDQAKALNLRMVVRIRAAGFEMDDAHNLAQRAWQPNVRSGFGIVPDSVHLLPPEVVRSEGDVLVLRVHVDAIAAALVSEQHVTDAVRGRRTPDAINELGRIFLVAEQPQVVIKPSWANRAFRVHVSVKNE